MAKNQEGKKERSDQIEIRSPSHTKQQEEDIRRVISFVKNFAPSARAIYHHIDCPEYNGTEVEVHYRPHFMQSLRHNARLQSYFRKHADEQFTHKIMINGAEIVVPTRDFNIVFQISHIYQHLFNEGIGLRQILDYYYVLTSVRSGELEVKSCSDTMTWLGLDGIAGAICWILTEKFGMDRKYCVVEPDERRGKFVLCEILEGGNFGKYYKRRYFRKSQIERNLERFVRDTKLMRYFPSEALSEPIFRLYHAWWRMKYN